jgi:hypothetical protein
MSVVSVQNWFYFNSGSEAGTNWTNDTNAFDNDNTTYAYRIVPKNVAKETTKWIKGTGNNVPALDDADNPISNVYIRITYQLASSNLTLYMLPIYNGVDGLDNSMVYSSSGKTTRTWDITKATNAPATWTWNDVRNLDISMYAKNANTTTAYQASIYFIEIGVKYSTETGNYGIEIYNEDGSTILQVADRWLRAVASTVISSAGTTTFSNVLPEANSNDGSDFYCLAISLETNKMAYCATGISISGYDVIVTTRRMFSTLFSTIVYGDTLLILFGY